MHIYGFTGFTCVKLLGSTLRGGSALIQKSSSVGIHQFHSFHVGHSESKGIPSAVSTHMYVICMCIYINTYCMQTHVHIKFFTKKDVTVTTQFGSNFGNDISVGGYRLLFFWGLSQESLP